MVCDKIFEGDPLASSSSTTSLVFPQYFNFQGKRYRVTPKRWGILLLSCCILSLDAFCYYFFSFINDKTSFYFKISPGLTDMLTSFHIIGRAAGVIIVCFLTEWMTLRGITVYGSVGNCFAVLIIAIGVFCQTFWLTSCGMFLNGVFSGVLVAIVQVITMTWFPLNERGKASAAPWILRRLSMMLSNIIATRSLGVHKVVITQNATQNIADEHFMQQFQRTFTGVFGLIAFLTMICCMFAWLYVSERPPLYEESGDDLTQIVDEITPTLNCERFREKLDDLWLIIKNLSFVLYFFLLAFVQMDTPLGTTLISSIVTTQFPEIDDGYVGIVLCIGITVGSVGSAMAGQILDKFSKPQTTYVCFALHSILSLASFSICSHLHLLPGVFGSYLLLWSARDALSVCMYHRFAAMTVDQTHSIRVKTFCIAIFAGCLAMAATASIIRLLMNHFTVAVGVLYPMPFLLLSVFIYVYFWRHFEGINARGV